MTPDVANHDLAVRVSALEALASRPTAQPIDPTANVLKHVEGAVQRLDDLLALNDRLTDRINNMRDRYESAGAELREKLVKKEAERIDAVNLSEARRSDAQFAEMKAAVALASREAATTAAGIATTLAAQGQLTSDRLIRIEQWQAARGGQDVQRTESKTDFKSLIGWALAIPGIIYIAVSLFAKGGP